MDIKELQKLIKLAKKSGLLCVKVDDVELQFIPEAVKPKIKLTTKDTDTIKIEQKNDEMAALFWSVQDLDPLSEAQ